MAEYSQGGPPPPPPMMSLHSGRIPSFKNNHGDNFQMRGAAEPPACVQNAMMTKDKKPFTYTPGGLDLSQIKTPSMARRLNRQQQQQEDQENPAYFRQPSVNGGSFVPAPPPPPPPGPPPPPPLVINVSKPPKAVNEGERPEIVIPENPIGMLRKTNSPYHWESEQLDSLRQGPVPKFVDKSATPSPVAPQMRRAPPQQFSQQPPQQSPHFSQQSPQQFSQQPPQQFSQQSPQQFSHQSPQQFSPPPPQQYSQQSPQNYSQVAPALSSRYENNLQQQQNKSASASPIWKPEPTYPSSSQANHSPGNNNSPSMQQNSTPNSLQRQDSQFNHSPSPWGKESPFSNSSTTSTSSNQTISPSCDTRSSVKSATPISSPASPWRQEARNSPMSSNIKSPTQSPYNEEYRVTPIQIEARPMQASPQNNQGNRQGFKNGEAQSQIIPPWRQQANQQNSLPVSPINNNLQSSNMNNTQSRSPSYVQSPNTYVKSPSPPKQNERYTNMSPESEVRYQSHMTIPVTPRKGRNQNELQKEDSQNTVMGNRVVENSPDNLPWVRGQNTLNKAVPPPPWCQKPDGRKSLPGDSLEQSENNTPQSPWGQRPADSRKSLPRDTVQQSTPQTSEPQPPWVTDNRRYETLPRAQSGKIPSMPTTQEQIIQNVRGCDSPGRVIPIQMEVTKQEISHNNSAGHKQGPQGRNQPQLRIIIDMNQQGQRGQPQAQAQPQQSPHMSVQQPQSRVFVQQPQQHVSKQQPQQHITRILTPQLMRMDGAVLGSPMRQEPPSLSQQSKTRIIPIQMEPPSPGVTSPRIIFHKVNLEGPPRQSRSFRVLQTITGTQDSDVIEDMEQSRGYTDL